MEIRKILSSLRVKELDSTMHNIDKYMLILIYLLDLKRNDYKALTYIIREIYLINNLKVNLLIRNDIIKSKKIILNVSKNEVYINNYDIIIKIIIYNID